MTVCFSGPQLDAYQVFVSIEIGISIVILIISLTFVIMPKRKETFVYEFNSTMFVFDSETKEVNYEITSTVHYPTDIWTSKLRSRKKISE